MLVWAYYFIIENSELMNGQLMPPKVGEPPLHRAARIGDHSAIQALVDEGADINLVFDMCLDPNGRSAPRTPLMVAAGSGEGATTATVALLLELGADPYLVLDGYSAATCAFEGIAHHYPLGGDIARAEMLIERGSPLPDAPKRLNRLLCETASRGDVDRLRLLLERELDPRGYWSSEEAREDFLKFQVQQKQYRAENPDLLDPELSELLESLEDPDEDLLDLERETSAPSSYQIPLFRAVESGKAECVRMLLLAGADPTVRDSSMQSAIFVARDPEVIQALLEAGLSLEDVDQYGWTPLVEAFSGGDDDFHKVQTLVEAGADVNATHDRGYTVFMSAVGSSRYPALLRYLVSKGADPHAVSELGYNAFHAAIDVNFEANAEESVRDTLGYLRELGVDLEHRTQRGHTPLAIAIERGTALEVQVLCELGADANAVCPIDSCGPESCSQEEYPLLFHVVIGSGVDQGAKAEALLQAGANPLTTDAEGHLPVAHAVASLCSSADERDSLFREFFIARGRIPFDENGFPNTQFEFLNHVRPLVASFVEGFAAQIPMARNRKFDKEIRKERVECIVSLCAYEAWFRHVGQ